jgi:hypothetical protein
MNVLILATHGSLTPHCETELELAQIHLDQGDHVTFSYCDASLLVCDTNPLHDWIACKECISKRMLGLPLLSEKIATQSFLKLTQANRKEMKSLRTHFNSLEELRQYRIENFDIGYAVLSSIISDDRDPVPDLQRKSKLICNFIYAAFSVYRSVQNYLDEHPTDQAYVHNGRFAPVRAALRACQSRNVDCYLHDYGCDLQHYDTNKNRLLHEIPATSRRIHEHWDKTPDTHLREELGAKFYTDRARGVIPNWHSFLTQQQPDNLPVGFDLSKRNIAIFSSSEDEFEGIDELWDKTIYLNQLDGARQIVDAFATQSAFQFHLRLHPNLRLVRNDYTDQLRTLSRPNLTVIQPEASVSTYALMAAAEKVVTFGSTMGIEATFWGKPSILAGHALYEQLDSTYNPSSHEELVELLKTRGLSPKNKEGALKYGCFCRTYGFPFKYFKGTSVRAGEFKQCELRARQPWRYLSRFRRGVKLRQLLSLPFILRTRLRVMRRSTSK